MDTLHPLHTIKYFLLASITILASFVYSQAYAADVGAPSEQAIEPSVQPVPPLMAQQRGVFRRGHAVAQNHIVVKLSTDAKEAAFLEHAKGLGLRKLKKLHGTNWYTMAIPAHMGVWPREMAATARGLPGVIHAAADPILYINVAPPPYDNIPPNDPYYLPDDDPSEDCLIGWDDPCGPEDLIDQWGLFKVEAVPAWATQTNPTDVVIAVLDSGVAREHDDLLGNIWVNPGEIAGNLLDDDGNGKVDDTFGWDFVSDDVGSPDDLNFSEDNNPNVFSNSSHEWVADVNGYFGYRFDGDSAVGDGIDNNADGYVDVGVFHGTAVAGVAAMVANNNEGMVGACWHCKIMPVRVINAEGEALGSDIAAAIQYADVTGADIINASWGVAPGEATNEELLPMVEAIETAVSNGVTVVAAAGNGGNAGLYFPASMPETISVGSTDWGDQQSWFSTYAGSGDVLAVVAPGEKIWTSFVLSAYDVWIYNDWIYWGYPEPEFEWYRPGDDTYNGADGTSFAAPLVSGYAGLILSQNPCATPADVRQVLHDNAVYLGAGQPPDANTGYGRIQMVVPDLGCQVGAPTVTITSPQDGETVSDTIYITADANDDVGVTQVKFLIDGSTLGTDVDGNDGWSLSWDTSLAVDGIHTITAEVSDGTLTGSDSINVTVANSGGGSVMLHIGDLDASSATAPRGRWNATVTAVVHDSTHVVVDGAQVGGTWSGGAKGSATCTTNTSGQCSITKSNIKSNVQNVIFTIDSILLGEVPYEPGSNHDTDGDSDGTVIAVDQPGSNTLPVTSITTPTDGATYDSGASVSFVGTSNDSEDGDVTDSIVWESSIDGSFGSGGSASAFLADGVHVITAKATDSAGSSGSDSVSITVGEITETLIVSSANNGATWTATVTDTINDPLSGDWSYSGGDPPNCSNNVCSLSGIRKKQSSVNFTSDITGEMVTIFKP